MHPNPCSYRSVASRGRCLGIVDFGRPERGDGLVQERGDTCGERIVSSSVKWKLTGRRNSLSQCLLTREAKRWNIAFSWRGVVAAASDHWRTSARNEERSGKGSSICEGQAKSRGSASNTRGAKCLH